MKYRIAYRSLTVAAQKRVAAQLRAHSALNATEGSTRMARRAGT